MGQRVKLPAGKIGVFFEGSPPRVNQVNTDSPICNQVRVGQDATTLIITGLEVTTLRSVQNLVELLIMYAGTDHYLLLGDSPAHGPTIYSVDLPPGRLSVTFQGHTPTTVIKVIPTNPIANTV